MKKIDIINEMYNVINNNADVFQYADKYMINVYAKNVKTTKKATLEQYLAKLNAMVEEEKKVETVETEVENDTEYVAETKATKKDIIMGLHKNNEVKCDLATAEALATEGFIYIRNYEDGVLYGEVEYDAVCEDIIDEDDLDLFDEVREGEFGYHDIDKVTDWYDMGYLKQIEYGGDGKWYCDMNWDGILTDFCKRWGNKLNEAA